MVTNLGMGAAMKWERQKWLVTTVCLAEICIGDGDTAQALPNKNAGCLSFVHKNRAAKASANFCQTRCTSSSTPILKVWSILLHSKVMSATWTNMNFTHSITVQFRFQTLIFSKCVWNLNTQKRGFMTFTVCILHRCNITSNILAQFFWWSCLCFCCSLGSI